jgi:hypothetical protein
MHFPNERTNETRDLSASDAATLSRICVLAGDLAMMRPFRGFEVALGTSQAA